MFLKIEPGDKIHFVNAYMVALMQKQRIAGIYSFDKKHFDRISPVMRLEP